MKLYLAGFRLSDLKARPEIPPHVMFTFDDTSSYGDGEQRKLFRLLCEHRKGVSNPSLPIGKQRRR